MPERKTIDRASFVPYLLESITNRIAANAARRYQKEFGIGLGEWRVLSMLAVEPGCNAMRISELSGVDAAAISRSLHSLDEQGFVEIKVDPDDRRRRTLTLTPAGQSLHDAVLAKALEQQDRLLEALDDQERRAFVGTLFKLHRRLFGDAGPTQKRVRSARQPHMIIDAPNF